MSRLPQINGDDGIWGQILNDYLLVSHNADGSEKTAGDLPSWFQSGSGSPVGSVNPAQQGALYQDTANGGLYTAVDSTTGDWIIVGGVDSTNDGIPGFSVGGPGNTNIYAVASPGQEVYITDTDAFNNTGNGILWNGNGAADGQQNASITVGDSGQYNHTWNADGSIDFAGPLTISPSDSDAVIIVNVPGRTSDGIDIVTTVANTSSALNIFTSDGNGFMGWSPLGLSLQAEASSDIMTWSNSSGNRVGSIGTTGATIINPSDDVINLQLKGSSGQTANIQEWQDHTGNPLAWIAANGTPGGTLAAGTVTASQIESTFTGAGLIYQGTGSGTAVLKYPPGYEIGYDQITSAVNITSTTESAGTTILTSSAHTFDGSPVICEFFTIELVPPSNGAVWLTLFEGSTEISRIALVNGIPTGGQPCPSVKTGFRFIPSAGSHTYTIKGYMTAGSGSSVQAGAGGAGQAPPAYLRFTKV